LKCPVCGNEVSEEDRFCSKCGAAVSKEAVGFIIVTTPTIQGYRIVKVLGVVTGLTPRTRGFLRTRSSGWTLRPPTWASRRGWSSYQPPEPP